MPIHSTPCPYHVFAVAFASLVSMKEGFRTGAQVLPNIDRFAVRAIEDKVRPVALADG